MRIGVSFGILLWLAAGVSAQNRGGGGRPVAPPNRGPSAPARTPAPVRAPTPISRPRGPYVYPVIVGGYYVPAYYPAPYISQPYMDRGDDQGAPAQAQPDNSAATPPQSPVTPVIINYNFNYPAAPPNPVAADRPQTPAEDAAANIPPHYLIALKDHTIYAATAYWVEGDTLHYFIEDNVHNQVSLARVDREFTARLNKEAGLNVNLPAPNPAK